MILRREAIPAVADLLHPHGLLGHREAGKPYSTWPRVVMMRARRPAAARVRASYPLAFTGTPQTAPLLISLRAHFGSRRFHRSPGLRSPPKIKRPRIFRRRTAGDSSGTGDVCSEGASAGSKGRDASLEGALLQSSILTKLELRELFEKTGFPTGQKRRFLIFATEPVPLNEGWRLPARQRVPPVSR